MRQIFKTILLNLVVALGYFILARLGLELATLNQTVSPVWPATGYAIACLYLFGNRFWLGIAIGAFAANILTDGALTATLAISVGNTLEALAGALIIHFIKKYSKQLSYHTDPIAFSLAPLFASIISATVGVAALYFTDVIKVPNLAAVWVTWWIGDALGGLVVTPLMIYLRTDSFKFKNWKPIFGVTALALCSMVIVFQMRSGGSYLFLLFPVLLYAAATLPRAYVLVLSFLICTVSIFSTAGGTGPFSMGTLNDRLVQLQLFLAAIALTTLALSAWGKDKLSKIPAIVLLVCWTFSGIIFFFFENSEKAQNEKRFISLAEKSKEKIQYMMHTYEEAIRGGIGLYAASASVEYGEWRAYYNALNVPMYYPGVSGIGVVWPVTAKNRLNFEKQMRADGQPDFKIKPIPQYELNFLDRDQSHYVIKFIEPIEINKMAVGLDMGSEIGRRAAADLARDTGQAAITPKIILAQSERKNPGFLLLLPMYKKNYPLTTVEDRRKAILGWVYGPVIIDVFFSQVLKQTTNELEFEVFEGPLSQKDNILFSNVTTQVQGTSRFESVSAIQLGQRIFSIGFRKSNHFMVSNSDLIAWIGFFGSLASLLLANFMVGLQAAGRRTRELADELTKELSESHQKYKEGERRLRFALDGSNDGIWDWNILKSELYVSNHICETYGWPQISTVKTLSDLEKYPHPEDLPRIAAMLQKYFAGEIAHYQVETRYQRPNGEWTWVLTRGKISERSPSGKPIRMTGVHIDIDQQKKTQQLLEEAQGQLGHIANSVPSHISQWSHNLSCEFANESFANWYNIDNEKIKGVNLKDILKQENYETQRTILEKVLNGESYQQEIESVRPSDQETRWIIVTYLPNKQKNMVRGFFMFFQDVTDLKKAEMTAIKERQVALEATNIKSQFLANMSHEIRTPINGIIGMTNLLKATPLNDQQQQFAEVVSRSSDALLNIINDVLDFSKVEAGKLDLEIINFDLHELISDVVKSISFTAETKNISLHLESSLQPRSYYKGDPGRIRQVLLNLIGNAIKFTTTGQVLVKVNSNLIGEKASALRFEVTDTGVGISDEALHRMFQPFSQADASTSRRFGGTGLGLSICKQLVELMNGEIGVFSQLGKGSTFWFNLNLELGVTQKIEPNQIENMKGSFAARILIADDNRVNQQVALGTLRNLGYEPFAVGSGKEVLQALKDSPPFDLILMDCQMPEMDGYEATENIRRHENLKIRSLPVIAMTANALDGDQKKCLAAGMNDYVTKPVRPVDLFKVVEKWLTSCSYALNNQVAQGEKTKLSTEFVSAEKIIKGHILVVEDNVVNQKVMSLTLEKLGYTCDVTENGVEALKQIDKAKYDVILMDCQMPEMDGFETTKNIRLLADQRLANLPIVAVTANAFSDDKERCLSVGMDDFMVKPINAQNLARMIEKWKNKDRAAKAVVIDMTIIESLKSLETPGSSKILDNLFALFIETCEQGLIRLRKHVKESDLDAVASEGHKLKDVAANIGAIAFAEICFELEKIGYKQLSATHLPSALENLEKEYIKVVAELALLKMAAKQAAA